MSGKRRHEAREAARKARVEQAKRDAEARGVSVDVSALAPNNSYSQPDFVARGYFVDEPFVCQDCGSAQVWTAAQQKWWYEVAKGSVSSRAKRCRPCRRRKKGRREQAQLSCGDPNPYKNVALLLVKVRAEIEPGLLSAGYHAVDRIRRGGRGAFFLEYSRSDDLLSIAWEQRHARLSADLLTEGAAQIQSIATAEFSGCWSTTDIEMRLAPFLALVRSVVDGLREA